MVYSQHMLKKWTIHPSRLKGTLRVPPSKSQTMRALLFGLLAKGKSVIHDPLPFPDMIHACRLLGATVEAFPDRIEMVGTKINGAKGIIDAGNSGLILRLVGAVAALSSSPIILTGDHSVRTNRLVQPLLDGLNQLGAHAFALEGNHKAPLSVQGPLQPGQCTIDGQESQPVSGLLIATAFSPGPTEIFVQNPGELPWVQLTLDWLDRLGIPYTQKKGEYYRLIGKAAIEGFSYRVPGDLSSVAFPLAAAILTDSEVVLKNLDLNDPQGDKRLITLLQQMGAHIDVDEQSVHARPGGMLSGIQVDINDCVDALPILAVMGAFAEGETVITGAAIARKKECDRISGIVTQLKKMDAQIEERPDGLVVRRSSLKGAHVESYEDHRMALALAVAGLAAEGETQVSHVECVSKTFPDFQRQMQSLGAEIK